MKICICSYMGFESLNGSNLRVYHLANELIRRGHELRFITPSRDSARSCRERFGVDAEDVGLKITRFDRSRFKKYPIFAVKAGRKIRGCDLVFGQSLASALAVRLARAGTKKVIEYVDLWSEYYIYAHPSTKGRVMYRVLRKAEGFSMGGVDMVFTITEKLKSLLEERSCDRRKIRVVRDGVDTEMFKPIKIPGSFLEEYGLEREDYIIYQGGISEWDGVQFLVNSAPLVLKENPNIKFLIVGDGHYASHIKATVKKLKLDNSFIFTGWVPYSDMPLFMNLARINAVPIADAPCTQGVVTLKLFEAMSCGVPTIISDLPGPREHLRHRETAYLVKAENKGGFAKGINELLENKHLYNKIKINGLKMIPHYDWRRIARGMAELMLK